jgi:hypothetical protein
MKDNITNANLQIEPCSTKALMTENWFFYLNTCENQIIFWLQKK